MLTQDFILPTNGDWLALPLTSTFTVMNNVSNLSLHIRFGVSSTSLGFMIEPGDTMIAEETIYIRPPSVILGQFINTITVSR